MKAEIPAEGISLQGKYTDATFFRVQCQCGNHDDDIYISVEHDLGDICVTFESKQKTHWWRKLADWELHKIDNSLLYWLANTAQSFVNGLYQRLRITRDVWFKGYVEYQSNTLMSKQTALNMAQAIITAVEEFESK